MKKAKRFLPLLLAVTVLCSSPAFTAYAADTTGSDSTQIEAVSNEILTEDREDSNVPTENSALAEAGDEDTDESITDMDQGDSSAMEDEGEDSEKEVADKGDTVEESAAANAEESPEEDSSDASSEGLTEQTTTGKDDNETAEEDIADESGKSSAEIDGNKSGEEDGAVVLQSSVVNDSAITVSAQYDLNMFPEIASLHVEKWENPESVTPVTEAIQLLAGENPQWEAEDVCSIRIFSSQFLDGSGNPYSSDTNGQVSYFFELPSEEIANNYTYFVYDVSDDGTPVLMEYANIDAEQGTVSFSKDNANSFQLAIAALKKSDTPLIIDGAPFFDDQQSMIEYVREKAVHRESIVKVCVTSENIPRNDHGFDEIFKHTGNPAEGDYIRRNVSNRYVENVDEYELGYFLIEYRFSYYETPEEAQAVDAEVASLVSELGLKDSSKSDYEKVKTVYDYMVENVDFGYTEHSDSGYGAIIEHSCSFYGFALMFYRLALEAGLDCRIVQNDRWEIMNIVQVDGAYYLINSYKGATGGAGPAFYFLRGEEQYGIGPWSAISGEAYSISDFDFISFTPYGTAPDYTMTTVNKKITSSAAQNGRAKAILFFGGESENACKMLREIADKTIPGVDLIVACEPEIKSLIGKYYPASIPGVYSSCSNAFRLWEKVKEITGDGYGYDMGLVLINAQNQIVFVYDNNGDAIKDGFFTYLMELLSDPSAPPYQEASDDYGNYTQLGTCGDQSVWLYYSDGTLRVSGKGEINDWSNRPSSSAVENIKKIRIDSGITGITENILGNWGIYDNLTQIWIPSSVVSIDPGLSLEPYNCVVYGTYGSAAYKLARANGNTFVDPARVLCFGKSTVETGKTANLKATGLGTLTYSSSNTKIFTVSKTGVIKGVGPGTATVTIKAKGDSQHPAVTKKLTITVKKCATPSISKFTRYDGGVKITINKVTGVSKYRLFYKIGSSGWKKAGDITGSTLSFKCTSGKTYAFTVRALNQYGQYVSDYNKTGKKYTYVARPVISSISNPKSRTVKLTWKKVSNVDGYMIRYIDSSDNNNHHVVYKTVYIDHKPVVQSHWVYHYKYLTIKGASNVSKMISSLKNGSVYGFEIRSFKKVSGKNVYSPWSTRRGVKILK